MLDVFCLFPRQKLHLPQSSSLHLGNIYLDRSWKQRWEKEKKSVYLRDDASETGKATSYRQIPHFTVMLLMVVYSGSMTLVQGHPFHARQVMLLPEPQAGKQKVGTDWKTQSVEEM